MVVAGPYHDGEIGIEGEGRESQIGGNTGQATCANNLVVLVHQVEAARGQQQAGDCDE